MFDDSRLVSMLEDIKNELAQANNQSAINEDEIADPIRKELADIVACLSECDTDKIADVIERGFNHLAETVHDGLKGIMSAICGHS